ncbi:MAG: MBL fold metallo-hydrolase [Candidatus Gracilibacteria bacterium]|jgi:glyoxylase-like metal-dependent hydrolase (beta-lactamase superfamily II)
MIKQLFQGDHQNTISDGCYEIQPLSAGPVLIQEEGGKFILVDPGAFSHKENLITELAFLGITPPEIDIVFNTHHHLDHISNNFLFHTTAPIYTNSGILWQNGKSSIYSDPAMHKLKFPSSIQMIKTPGHTEDSVSFVYEEKGVTYVCAGDAVREDIIRNKSIPSGRSDWKKFVDSMKKIFNIADVIFPGHGGVIEGDLLEELHSIVKNM